MATSKKQESKAPRPVKAWAVLDSDGTINQEWIHKTRIMADMSGGKYGLDVIPVLIAPIPARRGERKKK